MEFELKDEYITLAQLLKACDVVYSGGQAKEYLANKGVQETPKTTRKPVPRKK